MISDSKLGNTEFWGYQCHGAWLNRVLSKNNIPNFALLPLLPGS